MIFMKKQSDFIENRFPMIKCECGEEILLLPDLTEMGKVIKEHAQKHAEKIENPKEAKLTYQIIELSLTAKTLRKASQI